MGENRQGTTQKDFSENAYNFEFASHILGEVLIFKSKTEKKIVIGRINRIDVQV